MNIITPWKDPEDLLDRQKYAEFLTSYLATRESSFVLNLNANWGMGKTYFLTHWHESLKETYPTVYVNAWESDFSEDPLVAVMASIYGQLSVLLPEEEQTIQYFSKKFKSAGRFLRSLAPIITKGIIKKTIGDEEGNNLLESISLSGDDISELTEKSMSLILKEHTDKEQSVIDFKIALGEYVSKVTKRNLKAPLFLFIDELDRCRPTYAIELLETIKHLFSVDGIIFVIATDSDQLQHSIRAIYGNDFNGGEYLRRFFDQEYILPIPKYESYCRFLINYSDHTDKLDFYYFQPWCLNNAITKKPNDWNNKDSIAAFLSIYASCFGISLRSINQVFVRLEAILQNSNIKWDGAFLLLLLIIQAKDRELFRWSRERVIRNDLSDVKYTEDFNQKFHGDKDLVRWFQDIGNSQIDDNIGVKVILFSYLRALGAVYVASTRNSLSKLIDNNKGLQGFITYNLALTKSGHNDYPDLLAYFDHIEMAGALS